MNCKQFKLLFNLVPVNRIRARMLDKHLSQCPDCRTESGADKDIAKMLNPPGEWAEGQDLWPGIKREIQGKLGQKEIKPRKAWGLSPGQWAFASLVLAAILAIPYLLHLGSPKDSGNDDSKIVIQSVKMDNQPAKSYYFKAKDKNKLFVWVQKT